jgi:hypothetical protein
MELPKYDTRMTRLVQVGIFVNPSIPHSARGQEVGGI